MKLTKFLNVQRTNMFLIKKMYHRCWNTNQHFRYRFLLRP